MNIYLIGFMGCGKSSIGKRLASRIGYDRIDTDDYIESLFGCSVSEVFANYGERKFRDVEFQVLKEFRLRDNLVISTGGGMVCSDMAVRSIFNGISIYIKADSKTLANRIYNSKKKRPLTDDKNLDELEVFVSELLNKREIYYNQATFIVDAIKFDLNNLIRLINTEIDSRKENKTEL